MEFVPSIEEQPKDKGLLERQYHDIAEVFSSIQSAIEVIRAFVDKPYYENLSNLPIQPCPEMNREEIADIAWLFRITGLAFEKEDKEFERKLGNVISAVGMCGGTLVMRIDYKVPEVVLQIGVVDKLHRTSITSLKDTLRNSFKGNFPGSKLEDVGYDALCGQMRDYVDNSFSYNCVTAVSSMARHGEDNKPMMGLESILHAAGEEPFSLIVLGEPMDKQTMIQMKELYENLATQLSKFINISITQQQGSSMAKGQALTEAVNIARNTNRSRSFGSTVTDGASSGNTERDSPNKNSPVMDSLYAAGAVLSVLKGNMVTLWAMNALRDVVRKQPDTMVDQNESTNHSIARMQQQSEGEGESLSWGLQKGINETITASEGLSAQYTIVNHTAKGLYDKIVSYLEWLNQNESFGMFHVCTYVLSASASTNVTAASQYASMMKGEGIAHTYGINTWVGDESREIRRYLSYFRHPIFVHPALGMVDPSIAVSGRDLVQNFLLPQKSVGKLSVLQYEPFGRNVVVRREIGENGRVVMGCIHHMGEDIPSDQVPVNLDSLSRHSFFAGANGTGKSTAIFTLLNKVYQGGIPFMVVEPAKGEYRSIFSGLKDVKTYASMRTEGAYPLRLNLFWFRKGIDVNEHVEKLVELFCSCWPMYAAMPQVLRGAIFNAYESCGWDLEESVNPYGPIFPHVNDVCEEIEKLIKNSAFSAEVQGNYIGSLLTRMQSLNKGIYKRIFSSENIDDAELFENSVIIDISRPDASDVKALLMGLIIIRHFEYCASGKPLGDILRHLTVLEEAHTLLAEKPVSGEGADIGNKSIEMMSRCIAELGGFGQGFIIADQAPGLLDRSVIRNTNTKMVFRLPDINDCELTGKAIGLSNAQCLELSRLPRGVCAIHQINWEEAVLCHIRPELPPLEDNKQSDTSVRTIDVPSMTDYVSCLLTPFSIIGKRNEVAAQDYCLAQKWAIESEFSASQRLDLVKAICPQSRTWRSVIDAVNLLGIEAYQGERTDISVWTEAAVKSLNRYVQDRLLILTLIEALLDLEMRSRPAVVDFHDRWFDFVKEERVKKTE